MLGVRQRALLPPASYGRLSHVDVLEPGLVTLCTGVEGSMLQSLIVLMIFQFLGELLVRVTGLPLPGPVCGMLFLLAWLRSGWTLPVELTGVATGLLDHFGLLFVPAGVSIIGFGALIMRDGPAIVLALMLSIAATVAITACAFGRRPVVQREASQRKARSRSVP